MCSKLNSYKEQPDKDGHFGDSYGGRYVAETLTGPLEELEAAYAEYKNNLSWQAELTNENRDYGGRPSALYFAEQISKHLGNDIKLYFKREELNHTGSHKINNVLGQLLLARKMGKKRIIAETGAGQHGVAVASCCARYGLECTIYMGEHDVIRQRHNIFRMELLGAQVKPVSLGSKTLKDAMNEALRDWVTNVRNTYYLIGTAAGPHPYPTLVRDFQSVIGEELKEQILQKEGRLPDLLVACIGGGSNAIGLFYPFLDNLEVSMVGIEGGGVGSGINENAAPLTYGSPGVLHGNLTYLLQDNDGQIYNTQSISAGLDYPGVGPEHAWLKDTKRVLYSSIQDNDALKAFRLCASLEGIIPAFEPSHALGYVLNAAESKVIKANSLVCVNLCGRGDKDMHTYIELSESNRV